MRHKRLRLSVVFLLLSGVLSLQAQETVLTAGNDVSGSDGTVSYSIGLVFHTTYTGSNGSVAQGAQQPYEINDITKINEVTGKNVSVLIFPNPTTDHIQLHINSPYRLSMLQLSYQLFNIQGKLLREEKLTSNRTNLTMNDFGPATYFINIFNGNEVIRTFKIIKN